MLDAERHSVAAVVGGQSRIDNIAFAPTSDDDADAQAGVHVRADVASSARSMARSSSTSFCLAVDHRHGALCSTGGALTPSSVGVTLTSEDLCAHWRANDCASAMLLISFKSFDEMQFEVERGAQRRSFSRRRSTTCAQRALSDDGFVLASSSLSSIVLQLSKKCDELGRLAV